MLMRIIFFARFLRHSLVPGLFLVCLTCIVFSNKEHRPTGCQLIFRSTKMNISQRLSFFDFEYRYFNQTEFHDFTIYFRQATAKRNSSYPFISGDTFRAFADHVFDETTDPNRWHHHTWKIQRGDIVFLSGEHEMMKTFFSNATFNQIRNPFTLVTHNSDASAPSSAYRWVLNDERILSWFASNPDYIHHKLNPIPIGFANTRWPHGNISAIKQAFYLHRKQFSDREILLYVNFKVENNPAFRSKALQWAMKHPNVSQSDPTSYDSYLKQLGNAKFVLSPPGNGLDCHRTWEAILMGAVPIVLRSRLDPLFVHASVLIVDDWEYLTMDYLYSLKYEPAFTETLFAKYWYQRLKPVTSYRQLSM